MPHPSSAQHVRVDACLHSWYAQQLDAAACGMQAVKWAFKQPWAAALRQQWYYRHLSAAAGCCNIIALMIANLVSMSVV